MKTMFIRIYKPKGMDVYFVFWGTTKKSLTNKYKKFRLYKYAAGYKNMLMNKYKSLYKINCQYIRE